MKLLRAAAIVSALGAAVPASAGPVEVVFANGRVTVRATDASLRQILQEWSQQGQTRIVGLEKVAGAPITLELVDVPEKQAIEILLRSVAGYMAAPRVVAGSPAVSGYDRLMILATSVAAPPPVGGPRPTAFAPPPPQAQPFPDPIQLANPDEGPGESVQPPGAPMFGPPTDPAAGPAGPLVPGAQVRPQMPGEAPPPGSTDQAAPPQGPLTAPRPGILPAPQQTPQPRQ
jgi:hypothetical protein